MTTDIERAFAVTPSKLGDDDLQFHAWFNRATSLQQSISSGYTDFVHKIFTQDFYPLVGDPAGKACLEIGFGGGRLLLPASRFFGQATGIDVHHEFGRVHQHLHDNGARNFTLFHTDEVERIADHSVDFAYSFITFQHFATWDVAQNYLKLLQRVMTDDGCGTLYFGRNDADGSDVRVVNPTSFGDFPMTLYVKPEFAISEIERHGFKFIDCATGTKHPWSSDLSRQFYVKFRRDW